MHRRDFLVISSWAAMAQALRAAPGSSDPANETYWSLVKRQFPLADDLLYLNAANVCPASRAVLDRHHQFERDFQANPSFQNRDKYTEIRGIVRRKMARLLNASDPSEIAFTRNTSESNCFIANGLPLKPGDEVVISSHNHPSNLDVWTLRARRDGIVPKIIPAVSPAPSVDSILGAFEKAITPRTRAVSVTHVTNVTGLKFPVKEIAAIARRSEKIWLHVDGAQSLAAMNVDLRDISCDSYSASTHKWLMGPLESGILYVRKEKAREVAPSLVTSGWSDSLPAALRFEVLGQQDDPRFCGIDAALDFISLIGVANIEARVRWLASYLKDQLRALPVELKTNREPALSAGVLKISTGEANVKKHYDELYRRHRVAIAKTDSGEAHGLRFSPHIYNSKDDLDRAVAAVKELAS
jgi:selenocysteine lyase/cysteine desulfurase